MQVTLSHCSKKNEHTFIPKKEHIIKKEISSVFDLVDQFKVKKYSEIASCNGFHFSSSKKIYFTNLFARAIFQTEEPFDSCKKIGTNGKGPYEYLTPYYLSITKNSIYFTDLNNPLVKYLPLNNPLNNKQIFQIALLSGAQKFIVRDNLIYILNTKSPLLLIKSVNYNRTLKKMITYNQYYDIINTKSHGGGIVFDKRGNLYISNTVPYRIYKILKTDNDYVLKAEWNFEKKLDFPFWNKREYDNYIKDDFRKKRNIFNSIAKIINLLIIGTKDEYLFVHLNVNNTNFYQIIDLNGNLIISFKSTNKLLLGGHENILYFLDFHNKGGDYYKILKYKFFKENLYDSTNVLSSLPTKESKK